MFPDFPCDENLFRCCEDILSLSNIPSPHTQARVYEALDADKEIEALKSLYKFLRSIFYDNN